MNVRITREPQVIRPMNKGIIFGRRLRRRRGLCWANILQKIQLISGTFLIQRAATANFDGSSSLYIFIIPEVFV